MKNSAVNAGMFDQPDKMTVRIEQRTQAEQTTLSNTTEIRKCPPGVGNCYASDFRPMISDVSSAKPLAPDGTSASRPWSPYAKLRAIYPTAFAKDKPVVDYGFGGGVKILF